MFAKTLTIPKNQFNPTVVDEGYVPLDLYVPADAEFEEAALQIETATTTQDADLDITFNGYTVLKDQVGSVSKRFNVTQWYTPGYAVVHVDWNRTAWASGLWDQVVKVRIDLYVTTKTRPEDVTYAGQEFVNDLQALFSGQLDAVAFTEKYKYHLLAAGGVGVLAIWAYKGRKGR